MRGRTAVALGYVIEDAREELHELSAGAVDPWSLTDAEVVDLVDAGYLGGWSAFLRNSAA
ncbi:hypothetical protein [Salinispora pacifica]|uniref:hypothetical protein n=1 Tax=Salinispora pacifica TaxID=351187 RepID=UPI00039AB388|nr:hypothetical protein [Salinispora pacifica]